MSNTTVPTIDIQPVAPDGVGDAITHLLGIVLWLVEIAAILGLLVIALIGIQSYRHGQAQEFVTKFTWWGIGCAVAASAIPLVKIFFPAMA